MSETDGVSEPPPIPPSPADRTVGAGDPAQDDRDPAAETRRRAERKRKRKSKSKSGGKNSGTGDGADGADKATGNKVDIRA